jgi:octaprenyl-diphosphate synthase
VVCEGELLQIDNRNNLDLSEETYFQIIERKTASLTAVCCRLGAEFAGAGPDVTAAMETFGRNIGVAFQIQDDLLDLTGNVAQVGKSLGADAEKGKLTLPVIHFMRTAPVQHRELLRSLLGSNEPDRSEKIRNLIGPSPSLRYAEERAQSLVAEARHLLGTMLPPTTARDCLDELARLVVVRDA